MKTAIIIIIALVGAWAWFAMKRHEKKKVSEALNKVPKFNPSEIFVSPSIKTSIAIDSNSSSICFVNSNRQTFHFEHKDILECEIILDGKTYLKQSTSRTIAGAVIGGAIGGKTGAIVGGLSGKSKKVVDITNIDLKIVLNSSKNPYFKVNFFNPQLKKGQTITDQEALENAKHWHTLVSGLVKKADREFGEKREQSIDKDENSNLGVSDELLKLNELKEKGIITPEEFESQKAKLLS